MAGVEIPVVIAGVAGGHIRGHQQPRRGRGLRQAPRGEPGRRRPRARRGPRGQPAPGPRDHPRAAPDLPGGRPGRREGAARHVGGAPRGRGAPGHREPPPRCATWSAASTARGCRCRTSCSSRSPPRRRCISAEEKELGILLIDLGGGTTDVALFRDGAVWHTSILPLGGDHISNDIAVGLRTPTADAEELKKRHGCALTALVREDEVVDVPSVGGRKARQLSRQILSEIIQPRVEEIFTLVARDLARGGLDDVAAGGVVVTGGSSIMHGRARAGRAGLRHAGATRGARGHLRARRRGAEPDPRHRGGARPLRRARHGAGAAPTDGRRHAGRSHRPAPEGLVCGTLLARRRGKPSRAAGQAELFTNVPPVRGASDLTSSSQGGVDGARSGAAAGVRAGGERRDGEDQGDRPRRGRLQRDQPHDGGLASPASSSSSANTDLQALRPSPAPVKLQLGARLTQGLGAGSGSRGRQERRPRGSRADQEAPGRRRHGVRHRGPRRRHRHRLRADRGRGRQGARHPHRGGGDQAVRLRGPQARAPRPRRAWPSCARWSTP